MKGKRRKHIPLRTCVACREKQPKRELVRLVCTPEGTLEVDLRGKRAGRGAYVCRKPECWQAALQPQRLSRALKCQVSAEDAAALEAQMTSLFTEPAENAAVVSGAVAGEA